MWNLKQNKRANGTKQNRITKINLVIAREQIGGGRSKIGEGDYEAQTISYKINKSQDVIQNIRNTVNNSNVLRDYWRRK